MNAITLNLHILAAVILAGGSLIAALVVLPQARQLGDPKVVLAFQRRFFLLAAPALLIQVITGPMLAAFWVPDPLNWLPGHSTVSAHIFGKLFMLVLLVPIFLHARFRMGPKVARGEWSFRAIAWHAVPQAILAVGFLVLGVSIRMVQLGG
ncbi:MAG: hypothetical protein ISR76_05825 [Planctomycetes bacterium]|nr:hypothetical protein [Planctomycetota bacterium]MBL7008497.1 hypothetical protein [Planctomycetota bacterium]